MVLDEFVINISLAALIVAPEVQAEFTPLKITGPSHDLHLSRIITMFSSSDLG